MDVSYSRSALLTFVYPQTKRQSLDKHSVALYLNRISTSSSIKYKMVPFIWLGQYNVYTYAVLHSRRLFHLTKSDPSKINRISTYTMPIAHCPCPYISRYYGYNILYDIQQCCINIYFLGEELHRQNVKQFVTYKRAWVQGTKIKAMDNNRCDNDLCSCATMPLDRAGCDHGEWFNDREDMRTELVEEKTGSTIMVVTFSYKWHT